MWRKVIIKLGACVAAIVLGVLIVAEVMWLNVEPRCGGDGWRRACISNLKQIDGAKATWALENHVTNDVEVTASEIFGETNYIRDTSLCPGGGTYCLGKITEKPRCSAQGHTF